jgi:hypothetical protein
MYTCWWTWRPHIGLCVCRSGIWCYDILCLIPALHHLFATTSVTLVVDTAVFTSVMWWLLICACMIPELGCGPLGSLGRSLCGESVVSQQQDCLQPVHIPAIWPWVHTKNTGNFWQVKDSKVLFKCSQELVAGPFIEALEYSPHPYTLFLFKIRIITLLIKINMLSTTDRIYVFLYASLRNIVTSLHERSRDSQ